MNRWAKNGVLDRVFEKLQTEQIVRIKIEAFSLDSTSVKVHPDGTGALRKTAPRLAARLRPGKGLAGYAWGFGMEADARKIASGGKCGYIGSQPKGKTEIPAKRKSIRQSLEPNFWKRVPEGGHSSQ